MTITPTPPSGKYNTFINAYADSPVETITSPYDSGYEIRPNQLFVFPVSIGSNTRVIFNLMHTQRYREDFSLGCWFSTHPNVPVLFYPNLVYDISVIRSNQGFCLQDINYSGSAGIPDPFIRTILVQPGTYYFNVQNRVNGLNKFEFVFQSVQLI